MKIINNAIDANNESKLENPIINISVKDEGSDIFVHHSSINMSGFKTLDEGDKVEFDVEEGKKGPAAGNVVKV